MVGKGLSCLQLRSAQGFLPTGQNTKRRPTVAHRACCFSGDLSYRGGGASYSAPLCGNASSSPVSTLGIKPIRRYVSSDVGRPVLVRHAGITVSGERDPQVNGESADMSVRCRVYLGVIHRREFMRGGVFMFGQPPEVMHDEAAPIVEHVNQLNPVLRRHAFSTPPCRNLVEGLGVRMVDFGQPRHIPILTFGQARVAPLLAPAMKGTSWCAPVSKASRMPMVLYQPGGDRSAFTQRPSDGFPRIAGVSRPPVPGIGIVENACTMEFCQQPR